MGEGVSLWGLNPYPEWRFGGIVAEKDRNLTLKYMYVHFWSSRDVQQTKLNSSLLQPCGRYSVDQNSTVQLITASELVADADDKLFYCMLYNKNRVMSLFYTTHYSIHSILVYFYSLYLHSVCTICRHLSVCQSINFLLCRRPMSTKVDAFKSSKFKNSKP